MAEAPITQAELLNIVYPVGSVYMSANPEDPATLFGGSWVRLENRFLISAGNQYGAGAMGGSTEQNHAHSCAHTHTEGDLKAAFGASNGDNASLSYFATDRSSRGPAATTQYSVYFQSSTTNIRGFSHYTPVYGTTSGSSTSSSGTNVMNIMPPYLTVYMWKRTA